MARDASARTRVAIIGAGAGGTALLRLLTEAATAQDTTVSVVGIADRVSTAPALALAAQIGIPTVQDYRTLIKPDAVDLIIDVTGNPEMGPALRREAGPIEVVSGASAKFFWDLISARLRDHEETTALLTEHQHLYKLGQALTHCDTLATLAQTILDHATSLTHTPAGSLTFYEEEQGEMVLLATKGFGQPLTTTPRWKVRPGGLTGAVLNRTDPLMVEDLTLFPHADNPILRKEGIQALLAVQLKTENRIVGILYVNDFAVRRFTAHEVSLLTLVANTSTPVIDKLHLLETARLQANTDGLTGLHNHRYFTQQLHVEFSRANRYRRPFALIMGDIDFFKHLNDTHGHEQGNEALKTVSQLLRITCRTTDLVARYGGEEFAVIMPESDLQQGLHVAERVRQVVAQHPFPHGHTQPNGALTLSLGVAVFPRHAATARGLVEAADQALYLAKRQGRNQVGVAAGSTP
ncbi:MAG: diguanylate cyclase [Nitrospirae bacterium]|nr:diguanylate cyclase [Nitrospirota bacterium]